MDRILVGRPRGGPRVRTKRRKIHQRPERDPETTLRRESMSRRRGTKWLNENLAPLVRYLRSRVGDPWNDVYSDISSRLRATNAVQQHVRDHLADYVVVKTWREDGTLYGVGYWRGVEEIDRMWGRALFYVDPDTGLLAERRRRRKVRRPQASDDVAWAGAWCQLRRIDGAWYAFGLQPIPDDATERACRRDLWLRHTLEDLLRGPNTAAALRDAYGRTGVFAATKMQLSKKAIRDHFGQRRRKRRNR